MKTEIDSTKYAARGVNPTDYGLERIYIVMNMAYVRDEDERDDQFLVDLLEQRDISAEVQQVKKDFTD